VVHGTELGLAWKIASAGFAALSTLDAGFYGRGIYFSSSAMYTLPYFANKRCPAILICLTAPGNPYPVIENPNNKDITMLGRPMISGFQSHYVITGPNGFPPTERKLERIKRYDELVIGQEAQIAPIFLLEIDNSNLSLLMANFLKKKSANERSVDDSEEHRSVDQSLGRSHEEKSLRNVSSAPKNQSQKRKVGESAVAKEPTLSTQSRKYDQSHKGETTTADKRKIDQSGRKFDDIETDKQ